MLKAAAQNGRGAQGLAERLAVKCWQSSLQPIHNDRFLEDMFWDANPISSYCFQRILLVASDACQKFNSYLIKDDKRTRVVTNVDECFSQQPCLEPPQHTTNLEKVQGSRNPWGTSVAVAATEAGWTKRRWCWRRPSGTSNIPNRNQPFLIGTLTPEV